MKKLLITSDDAGTSKRKKKPLKRKRDNDDEVWAYYLKTRMSPKMLLTLINSNLSEQQVTDIKAMGFGGLLTLKTDSVPGALGYWLVSRFNTCSSSLMEGKLVITDEDIHLAVGIPMGSNQVNIASKCDKSEEFIQFRNNWLTQFDNNPPKIETKDILKLIISQREGGEEFKRNFIVFIVSTFLMGVKGSTASLRVLKCLRDVSSVSSLNWCGFTRKQFIEGVESWRRSKNDFFKGPIMVFVFLYLDRVAFKYYFVPRVFPTLSTWTKEEITRRLKCEQAEGFGTGGIQPRIVKGIIEAEILSDPPEPSNQVPKDSEMEDIKRSNSSSVKNLANCANILAISYESFSEALIEAKTEWPECKIVKQMAQMAEAFTDCSYSSQPSNCDVKGKGVNNPENKPTENEKEQEKGPSQNQNDSEGLDPCVKFSKLEFQTEEELFAALVKLETVLGKRPANVTRNVMNEANETRAKATELKSTSPTFVDVNKANETRPELVELKSMSPTFVEFNEAKTTPILVDSESQEFKAVPVGKKEEASTSLRRSPRFIYPSPPTFTPPSFNLLSSEPEPEPEPVEPLEVEPISSLPPLEPEHVEPLEVPISRRKISKRQRVETEVFRSPFLQRSIRVVGNLNKIERDLLEYVFEESFDESEILFQSDHQKLSRRDLKTLISGDRVPESVMHVWCSILNESEKSRARESPFRLYLPQTDADTNTSYIDVNHGPALIFVPIISQRPFAFCFNFLTSKLEILHVMRPKSVQYDSIVQSTRDFLVRCLAKKMSTIEEEVSWQLTEEFVPKSNLGDGTDSGIYLMRLLEKYKGTRKAFAMGLQDNNQVKLFGGRVCYQMLSFKGNRLKDKVLYDSESFSKDIRFEVIDEEFHNLRRPQRQLTDTEVLTFVINSRKDNKYLNEIVVDTEWIQVTRKELRTLQNRHWLMDTVIDMFGVMCTYTRQDILYLPSTVRFANATKKINPVNIVWCPYVKMHYKPQNATTINKVFFTIGKEQHWLACVSDLEKKKNFILDSLKPKSKDRAAYNTYVEDILYEVANRMDEIKGYERLKNITVFETVHVDVPQQPNTCDCGVFVMKFLEAATTDPNLWTDKNHFKNLNAYRRQVMLQLLKWEKNTVKVEV